MTTIETRHANTIEKVFRIVYSDQLPPDHELNSPPPGGPLVNDVLENGIIQPVGLNFITDEDRYEVVYGRRRIKAARLATAKAKKDKKEMIGAIPAMVAIDLTDAEVALWALMENAHGSDNPLSDIRSIRSLLIEGLTYEEIAKAIHKPKSYIIITDQKYGTLDERFLTGMEEGRIAAGVAEKISKQSSGVQEKLLERFDEEGKITGTMIAEAKEVQQKDILGSLVLPDMNLPEVEKHSFEITISQWDLEQAGVDGLSPIAVGWRVQQIIQEEFFQKALQMAVQELKQTQVDVAFTIPEDRE
jgi:ParB-like chromosome segregation protein Spo0J